VTADEKAVWNEQVKLMGRRSTILAWRSWSLGLSFRWSRWFTGPRPSNLAIGWCLRYAALGFGGNCTVEGI